MEEENEKPYAYSPVSMALLIIVVEMLETIKVRDPEFASALAERLERFEGSQEEISSQNPDSMKLVHLIAKGLKND